LAGIERAVMSANHRKRVVDLTIRGASSAGTWRPAPATCLRGL